MADAAVTRPVPPARPLTAEHRLPRAPRAGYSHLCTSADPNSGMGFSAGYLGQTEPCIQTPS